MLLNLHELQKYIKATAGRADMSVYWCEANQPPRTDGKNLFIPKLNAHAEYKDVLALMYAVAHEVSHVLHTNFNGPYKKATSNPDSLLNLLFNFFEDTRVDWLNGEEFVGDKQVSEEYVHDFVTRQADRLSKESLDEMGIKALSVAWMATHERNEVLGNLFYDVLKNKGSTKYADAIAAGNYIEQLSKNKCVEDREKGTTANYMLAERVLKEVFKEDPPEEKKQEQQQAEGNGTGGEGDSEKGKQKGASGSGSGKEGGEEEKEGEGHTDVRKYSLEMSKPFDKSGVWKGHHVDYSGFVPDRSRTYVPDPLDRCKVVDYKTTVPVDGLYGAEVRNFVQQHIVKSAGFANLVRTKLQVRSRSQWQYGQKRGKLNKGSLYRVTLEDAKGFNERVFKNKIEHDTLNTAVSVLIDTSGSMQGKKFEHAALAAVLLSNAIGNTLRVPIELIGFTEDGVQVHHLFLHRTFDEKLLSEDVLVSRLGHSSNYMCNNVDGESILFAYDRLRKRKEKRKILIVLSDGSPCGGRSKGSIYEFTEKAIETIEERHDVQILGVGILDDNVTKFYKEHYVINNVNDLEPALLSLIDKKLI